MLSGRRILVAETNYYLAIELVDSLSNVGATVLGPLPTEDAALDLMLPGQVDLVVFNALLQGQRATLLAQCLSRYLVPSIMVNDVWLPSHDPLCQGRQQMLHPVTHTLFHQAIAALLKA